MYAIRPYQDYSFRCWCSNNSVRPFSYRCFFKLFCGRSWHFLLHSSISIIYLLFFCFGGIVMLLFSTHHLVCLRSCSFHDCPFNRSVVSSAQVLFILSSLTSIFNRSAIQICSSLFLFSNGVFSASSSPLYSFLEMD